MSGNEIDTRPRVCLTKPNRSVTTNAEHELPSFTPEHIADEVIPSTQHQREITPVHLCAEYSPEPPTSDFVKILYDAVAVFDGYFECFFQNRGELLCPYDVEIHNNRVVAVDCLNPLKEKRYIESPSLNVLQDLGEYMASTGATVKGIISLLISREDDFGKMPLYSEWCKLLRDIRDNDVSKIEAVLSGESEECYSSLGCCSEKECFDVLPKRVHCYLFTALQDVLERETEVMVNPLFLFLCENLRCYPAKYEQGVKMIQEVYSMYQLTAYGAFNESRLALAQPNKLLSKYVNWNGKEGTMFNALSSGIIFMGICCIPIIFCGWESTVWAAITIGGGVGVGVTTSILGWIAEKIYRNSKENRFYQHKQLGYTHWKSNFIPTTAAQSAAMQIESLKMLADEITGERNDK